MIKNANGKNSGALKWLSAYAKGQKGKLFCLVLANAFFSVLSVAFAFAVKAIIDGATGADKDKLIFGTVFIISLVILQFFFRIVTSGLSEHIKGRLEITYKSRIFSVILNKRYDKIKEYHSGELINRLTSDVSVVSDGITTILPSVVSSGVRLICAVVALVLLDWIFAVAFIVAGVLVFAVIGVLRGKLKALHKKTLETDGKVRAFMQESMENILALKVFSVNDKVEHTAAELQRENFRVKMKRKNYAVIGSATYNFIFSAGYLFALIYGGLSIFHGTGLSYGDLSAILQLVNNVQVPFASLSSVFPKYYAMTASAERLMEIENLEDEPQVTHFEPSLLYDRIHSIHFDDVSFSYGRDAVFKNADAIVRKGEFVAVTGNSGIGKSTLFKLLLGVYEPEGGEIYFDAGVEKITAGVCTRSVFSYVPQGNMLFSGTLRDNVTFIKSDASEARIEDALKISCVSDFLGELPEGLETRVGENGVGLSEGQIQRVAIARAVLCDAPVILLDEATSALDAQTELKVLNNLKQLRNKTLIIISHRKAALGICDSELRLEGGKIKRMMLNNRGITE